MVEHAVVMAVVAGGVFLAIATLGYVVRSSFDQFAQQMAHVHAQSANDSLPADETVSSPAQTVVHPHPIPWTMRFETWIAFASMATLFVFVFNMLVLRKAIRDKEEEESTQREQSEQVRDAVFHKRQEIFRILASDMDVLLLESRLEVRHVMSRRVTAVEARTPVAEVRNTMKEKHMRHLLVCKGTELIGIISDRDLRKRDARTAADLMTADPLTVEPATLLNPAITQLVQRRISCLPVVDHGAIVGVLTSTDLMMTLQCALQVLRRVAGEVTGEEDTDGAAMHGGESSLLPAVAGIEPQEQVVASN